MTSDKGWVLERLATEIANRYSYVVINNAPDPKADMNYYMTYSCRHKRVSAFEMAYFAHLEPAPEAGQKFFAVAEAVDYCVCHSSRYAKILNDHGVNNVTAISPGIDLERFKPRLKIGIVGRTYHTGRKGEHLVASVMDIPGIDWHFTGDGWPLPGKRIPEPDLPSFYREMDYILVPSLYEGGPMCVAEALACGTRVIAADVGWVNEFPHIPFELGDAADLRRVLLEVLKQKEDLRSSVIDRTWQAWADGHHQIFKRFLGAKVADPQLPRPPAYDSKVALVLHGSESSSPGGPTVRVPRLAEELRHLGLEVSCGFARNINFARQDILHYFNIWAPESAMRVVDYGASVGKPIVFSPIFLNLAGAEFWQKDIPKLFSDDLQGSDVDKELSRLAKRRNHEINKRYLQREIHNGFRGRVRDVISRCDHVIFLSNFERQKLEEIGAVAQHYSLVYNPIQAALWQTADPSLFQQTYGVSDYILCVARLEPRKNQLMLLHALRDLDLPIVFIGHQPSPSYLKLVRGRAGANVLLLDRLAPNSPMLISAVAGARVFVLPSWAEGAPLSALEAAAAGVKLVLSDASGEREYLGDRALYCEPGDPDSIRAMVLKAYDAEWSPADRLDQNAYIAERFSWERHVAGTLNAYSDVLARKRRNQVVPVPAGGDNPKTTTEAKIPSIILDVTTSTNRVGRWTGIARVEMAIAKAMLNLAFDPIFIAWNDGLKRFVRVPAEVVDPHLLAPFVASRTAESEPFVPASGSHLIVGGSGWMQSKVYPAALTEYALHHELILCLLIFDIIPTKFPFWFAPGYAPVFVDNLATILKNCDRLITSSASTKSDLLGFAEQKTIVIPPVEIIRLGDEIDVAIDRCLSEHGVALAASIGSQPFVLSVGAIHKRKNQSLLCDLWIELRGMLGSRCPKLVIVGGVAWNGEDVERRIKEDDRLAGAILVLDDVGDSELEWLYRNCLFTVYPSLYEGWGLPVGESLRHGKVCIAAAVSSIPEIAPNLTDLVDPLDYKAWLAKVSFYAGSAEARLSRERVIKAGYQSRGWDLVVRDLVSALQGTVRRVRKYPVGTVVNLANGAESNQFIRTGWHSAERWGRWSAKYKSIVEVSLGTPARSPLVMVALINYLGQTAKKVVTCSIVCNGTRVGQWRLRRPGQQLRTVCIPLDVIGADDVLRFEFCNEELRSPQVQGSIDHRMLGIGLAKFALIEEADSAHIEQYFDSAHQEADAIVIGRSYLCVDATSKKEILSSSLLSHSAWGLYSPASSILIELKILEQPWADLVCEVDVRPVASAELPLYVKAFVNNVLVASERFVSDEVVTLALNIPAVLRAGAQPLAVEFVATIVGSPKSLAIGNLEDRFGLGIYRLRATSLSSEDAPSYTEGETIEFGNGKRGVAWLGSGWNKPEKEAVWSHARRASLYFTFDITPSFLLLFKAEPRVYGDHLLTIVLNSVELPALTSMGMRVFSVPPNAASYHNTLDFVLQSTASPFLAETSDDERRLGVRLTSLKMVEPPLVDERGAIYRPAEHASFGKEWPLEMLGAADAFLAFRTAPFDAPKDVHIRVSMSVLREVSANAVSVTASLAGRVLATWSVVDEERNEHSIVIPARLAAPGGLCAIRIFEDNITNRSTVFVLHEISLNVDRTPEPPLLTLQTPLFFSAGADGIACLKSGWHAVESHGTWSRQKDACLELMVEPLDEPSQLDVAYRLVGSSHEGNRLSIELNGSAAWEKVIDSDDIGVATIDIEPRREAEANRATLALTVSRLFSPGEHLVSTDDRRLGVMVISAALRIKSPPPHVSA